MRSEKMRVKHHVRRGMHILLLAFVLQVLPGCPESDRGPMALFPETVAAIEGANSEYDDMNSAPPREYDLSFSFFFSSNRATQADNFDIESMYITFDTENGQFVMAAGPPVEMWPGTNTSGNEYGPALWSTYDIRRGRFYASDITGNLEIYHLEKGAEAKSDAINSDYDDSYPTMDDYNTTVYFASNREGNFDIYKADIPEGAAIGTWLSGAGNATIEKVTVLASVQEDTCPSVNGNLLVFASNRDGGYGGYDLYYSMNGLEGWSEPVNFGPEINTEYDEYRPVVLSHWDYANSLMIFSSNRPGGMGGFDLYYVGIPQKVR